MRKQVYKVLIVEDELVAREGLVNCGIFEKAKFRIVGVCENGMEALEEMRKRSPDLIVTDISMPLMDGLAFVEQVRKTKADTAVVILSCYDHFLYAKKAIDLNVVSYLLKPFDDSELLDTLEKVRALLDIKRERKQISAIERFVEKEKDAILLDILRDVILHDSTGDRIANLKHFGLQVDAPFYGLLSLQGAYRMLDCDRFNQEQPLEEHAYLLQENEADYWLLVCCQQHYSARNFRQAMEGYRTLLAQRWTVDLSALHCSEVFSSLLEANQQYRQLKEKVLLLAEKEKPSRCACNQKKS